MSIVQYCTSVLYSLFPSCPLLTAPAPRLMLPAPQISGLICAPAKVIENIIVEKFTALDLIAEEFDLAIDAMDARLEKLYSDIRERQRQRREAAEAWLAERDRQREEKYQPKHQEALKQ